MIEDLCEYLDKSYIDEILDIINNTKFTYIKGSDIETKGCKNGYYNIRDKEIYLYDGYFKNKKINDENVITLFKQSVLLHELFHLSSMNLRGNIKYKNKDELLEYRAVDEGITEALTYIFYEKKKNNTDIASYKPFVKIIFQLFNIIDIKVLLDYYFKKNDINYLKDLLKDYESNNNINLLFENIKILFNNYNKREILDSDTINNKFTIIQDILLKIFINKVLKDLKYNKDIDKIKYKLKDFNSSLLSTNDKNLIIKDNNIEYKKYSYDEFIKFKKYIDNILNTKICKKM